MSCICQNCGQRYKIDVNIPDDLWELIKGNANLLCGKCIFKRLEFKLKDYAAFEVHPVPEKLAEEDYKEAEEFYTLNDNFFDWEE